MTEPRRLDCAEVADLAPLFVLEALAPDEMAAVRAHLASCPEAHAELAAFGGTVAYLAELAEPIEPPATLKGRLMAAVAADLGDRSAPSRAHRTVVRRTRSPPPPPRSPWTRSVRGGVRRSFAWPLRPRPSCSSWCWEHPTWPCAAR